MVNGGYMGERAQYVHNPHARNQQGMQKSQMPMAQNGKVQQNGMNFSNEGGLSSGMTNQKPNGNNDPFAPEKFKGDIDVLAKRGIIVSNIEELGKSYCVLRSLGVETVPAYHIVKGDKDMFLAKFMTLPPVPGKVNSKTSMAKDFYSSEEVDRLTKEDLENPAVLKAVMDSMTKWKRK